MSQLLLARTSMIYSVEISTSSARTRTSPALQWPSLSAAPGERSLRAISSFTLHWVLPGTQPVPMHFGAPFFCLTTQPSPGGPSHARPSGGCDPDVCKKSSEDVRGEPCCLKHTHAMGRTTPRQAKKLVQLELGTKFVWVREHYEGGNLRDVQSSLICS